MGSFMAICRSRGQAPALAEGGGAGGGAGGGGAEVCVAASFGELRHRQRRDEVGAGRDRGGG